MLYVAVAWLHRYYAARPVLCAMAVQPFAFEDDLEMKLDARQLLSHADWARLCTDHSKARTICVVVVPAKKEFTCVGVLLRATCDV